MGQALFGKGKERGRVWQTSGVPIVMGSSVGCRSSRVSICCERSKLPMGFENARFNSKSIGLLGSQDVLGHTKSDAFGFCSLPPDGRRKGPQIPKGKWVKMLKLCTALSSKSGGGEGKRVTLGPKAGAKF